MPNGFYFKNYKQFKVVNDKSQNQEVHNFKEAFQRTERIYPYNASWSIRLA